MEKKEKGSLWFLVIAVIGIALLLYFQVFKKDTKYYLKKGYSGLIENSFTGIIKTKEVDHDNHNNTVLVFSNGNKLEGLNGYFWRKMQIGDSISKIKGDSIIQVFRNGDKIILEITPFYESLIEIQNKK